ncbi:hypothetical protein TYRP_022037 [Tyrophagus putrescentiae]|nr:hypothetical protein TYRP_022037 [Tyrophagus putrescentiae]
MDTNEDTCDGELLFGKHHHHHNNNNNNHNNHHKNNNNIRSTKESTADNSSSNSSSSDSDSSIDSIDSTEPANRSPVKPLIEPHVQPVRLLDPLFSLLLLLLHLLWWTALTSGRLLRYAYHLALSRWEAAHLEASLRRLPNIPRNVALGINTPTLEVERLVQLIGWCRRVPTITTVTVYHPYSMEGEEDEEGEGGGGDGSSLSSSFSKLRDRLQKQLAITTTISNHDDPPKKDFKVAFLPFTAGRQSLVEAARYLITTTTKDGDKEGDDQPTMITPEAISQYLTAHHYPHPDPELLLLFGDCRIYHGFPCWQIRLTETVFLPPLRWLTLSQFHQALKVFSKCEQRFGF